MTVDIGDVVRVVIEWDVPDGTIAQVVYHLIGVSGASVTDAVLGAAVEAAWEVAWLLIDQEISDTVLGSSIEVSKWDFTLNRFDGIFTSPLAASDGTNVGQPMAHGGAALVKLFTTASRRQARKYLPGMVEANQDDGTINAATLTQLALWGGSLDNPVTAGALTLNFCTFNTEAASPLFETAAQASQETQAEGFFAYQRRRKPGTGI